MRWHYIFFLWSPTPYRWHLDLWDGRFTVEYHHEAYGWTELKNSATRAFFMALVEMPDEERATLARVAAQMP